MEKCRHSQQKLATAKNEMGRLSKADQKMVSSRDVPDFHTSRVGIQLFGQNCLVSRCGGGSHQSQHHTQWGLGLLHFHSKRLRAANRSPTQGLVCMCSNGGTALTVGYPEKHHVPRTACISFTYSIRENQVRLHVSCMNSYSYDPSVAGRGCYRVKFIGLGFLRKARWNRNSLWCSINGTDGILKA